MSQTNNLDERIKVIEYHVENWAGDSQTVTHNLGRHALGVQVLQKVGDDWDVLALPVVTHAADMNSFTISAALDGAEITITYY